MINRGDDLKPKKIWIKAQSAIEYLTTYGWAILIIAIMMGVLVSSGILNQKPPQLCAINNNFICNRVSINTTGIISMNITQLTGTTINITGIGCASNLNYTHTKKFVPQINMNTGTNITESISCYLNNTIFSGKVGSVYSGYLIINYTNLKSNLNHVVVGKIVQTAT